MTEPEFEFDRDAIRAKTTLNNQVNIDIEAIEKMSRKLDETIDNYNLYGVATGSPLPPRYSPGLFPYGGPRFKEHEIQEELKKATIISWKEANNSPDMKAKIKITFGGEMIVDRSVYDSVGQEACEKLLLRRINSDYVILDKSKIAKVKDLMTMISELRYALLESERYTRTTTEFKGVAVKDILLDMNTLLANILKGGA